MNHHKLYSGPKKETLEELELYHHAIKLYKKRFSRGTQDIYKPWKVGMIKQIKHL